MAKSVLSALALLMLATPALSACTGMHTYGYCEDKIVHWYDPDTGEICDALNCGGDRAGPARTDVPGCPAYKGTLTRPTEPSYLPCWTGFSSAATTPSNGASQADTTTPTVSASSSSSLAASASSDSGESQVHSTTGGASSATTGSAALTTAPPASTPPADASTGTGSDAAGSSSSSTTVEPNAGSIVAGSWIAVVAGVALGAVAVI
ncbi:glycoside hydrolase [Chaetomidium leptoderma]|uniref:Glycoside hydrolase n=1 Tax=Chaetomidium leptoderma TaxID=669021 RepID=A0AAN6VLM0_9PEZI|nr:glycoside hydrolase [Chaetomidium leptoderma]